jgi:hypothetical protein
LELFIESPIKFTDDFKELWEEKHGLETINSQFLTTCSDESEFYTTYKDFDQEIIQVFNVNNVSNLVNWLIMHVEPGEESPLCVEFELYAQGMLQLYPAFVKLRKFSNVSLPRTSMAIEEDQKKHTNLKVSKFNSCSYHDYI